MYRAVVVQEDGSTVLWELRDDPPPPVLRLTRRLPLPLDFVSFDSRDYSTFDVDEFRYGGETFNGKYVYTAPGWEVEIIGCSRIGRKGLAWDLDTLNCNDVLKSLPANVVQLDHWYGDIERPDLDGQELICRGFKMIICRRSGHVSPS